MIWNCVWFVLWYEIIYDVICLKQTETIGQRNGTPYWPCLYWHLIRTLTLWTHTFPKINMSPKSRDYFNRDIHHHTSCNHWFSGARFVSRRVPPLEFKSVCVFLEVEEKREEQITRIYIYIIRDTAKGAKWFYIKVILWSETQLKHQNWDEVDSLQPLKTKRMSPMVPCVSMC